MVGDWYFKAHERCSVRPLVSRCFSLLFVYYIFIIYFFSGFFFFIGFFSGFSSCGNWEAKQKSRVNTSGQKACVN